MSVMTPRHLATVAVVKERRKGRSSSPAFFSKSKTDGDGQRTPERIRQERGMPFEQKGAKFHADSEYVKTRHVSFGSFRVPELVSKRLFGATNATSCIGEEGKPSRKSKVMREHQFRN